MKAIKRVTTIIIIFITIYSSGANNSQNNSGLQYRSRENSADKGKPSKIIRQLYRDYKLNRFSHIESYSTGAMAKWINKVKKFLLEAPAGKIKKFKNYYQRLVQLRIYHEFIQGKYAFVSTLWIYRPKKNERKYHFKVKDMLFLLVKKNNKWYIKNTKFEGEYIIHNIKRAKRIQRAIERSQRLRLRRPRTRNRRYRRRNYRR